MVPKSFEERRSEDKAVDHVPSFEETYPRYEFAEMVRLGLVLAEWLAAAAGWLAKAGRRVQSRRRRIASSPSPGEMHPAE
jgi:hypothetical protein